MSQKKTILFICNEPNYDLYNRRSAIDSILCSILHTLQGEYTILVNGAPFEIPKKTTSKPKMVKSGGIKSIVARFIPQRVKERIKMKRLIKHTQELYDSISRKELSCDYVFELYKIGSDIGMKMAKNMGAEYIVYYDSPVVQQYEDIWKQPAPFRQELLTRQSRSVCAANQLIVYSNPVKEFLRKMGAKGQIQIFQTLDYSRLSRVNKLEHQGVNIGFIGSFMPWHRVDMLVRAFEYVSENSNASCHLYLIGDGETRFKNEEQVKVSQWREQIDFTGFVDGEKLEYFKSILDIGIMPGSNWYGMPTKVFEYGVSGIASIAPNTPTIEDLFDNGENIVLFDWDDQNALNQVLLELVENTKLRLKIAESIQSNMDSTITVESALSFYKSLFK